MRWLLPWILAASSVLQVSLETARETRLLQTHLGLMHGGLGERGEVRVGRWALVSLGEVGDVRERRER